MLHNVYPCIFISYICILCDLLPCIHLLERLPALWRAFLTLGMKYEKVVPFDNPSLPDRCILGCSYLHDISYKYKKLLNIICFSYFRYQLKFPSTLELPGYGTCPKVNSSISKIPKDQTSDLTVNFPKLIASGAVHLTGNLAPWCAEYSLSTITRANPKSATLVIKFSPNSTFLAAKSR